MEWCCSNSAKENNQEDVFSKITQPSPKISLERKCILNSKMYPAYENFVASILDDIICRKFF